MNVPDGGGSGRRYDRQPMLSDTSSQGPAVADHPFWTM